MSTQGPNSYGVPAPVFNWYPSDTSAYCFNTSDGSLPKQWGESVRESRLGSTAQHSTVAATGKAIVKHERKKSESEPRKKAHKVAAGTARAGLCVW